MAQSDGSYNPTLLTGKILKINKNNSVTEDINPPNFTVDFLAFYVRPIIDPYTNIPNGSLAKIQPMVSFAMQFTAKLPTGEQVPIYYQTSVSSDKFDVLNQ